MTVQTDHTPLPSPATSPASNSSAQNNKTALSRCLFGLAAEPPGGHATRHCDGPALPPHCLTIAAIVLIGIVGDGRHHRLASRLPEEEARLRRLDQFPALSVGFLAIALLVLHRAAPSTL